MARVIAKDKVTTRPKSPDEVRAKVIKEHIMPKQIKIEKLLSTLRPEDKIPGRETQKYREVMASIKRIRRQKDAVEDALDKKVIELATKPRPRAGKN